MEVLIEAQKLGRWYGRHLALHDVDWTFEGGIVGLVGPNGAGKTTFLRLLTGLIAPSTGFLQVFGMAPFANPRVYRHIGFAPERPLSFDGLTPLEFLSALGRLRGLGRKEALRRAEEALERVELSEVKSRKIGTFSKGMRQRTKIASAILHEPRLLVLDEPLNGMDPLMRRHTLEFFREYTKGGDRHILFSSHVLYEIESLTSEILLIHKGRIRARGSVESIRSLMDGFPHHISIVTPEPRKVASRLIEQPWVQGVEVGEKEVTALTSTPEMFYREIASFVVQHDLPVQELYSEDNNLEAVFQYLVHER